MWILSQDERTIIDTTGETIEAVGGAIYVGDKRIGDYSSEGAARRLLVHILGARRNKRDTYSLPASDEWDDFLTK